jgi:tripartite-type tricarboxylate transporter receptor subunit TctC
MTLVNKIILVAASIVSTCAFADPFKEIPKNVQIYIPYGPGGVADVQYRHLEQYLLRKGITLTAVYKPGANSTIAAADFSTSAKDGSVLMLNSTSNSWLAEQRLNKKVIDPIITTGGNANAIITYPGSKYENVNDFIRYLKAGDPDIKIGWHAVANLLNIRQLADKAGAPTPLTVPYKTSTDSSRDVAGKHLPIAIVPMTTAIPLLETGKVKLILGFAAGSSGLPSGTYNIRTRYPDWKHDELFFIGLPPGSDDQSFNAWSVILKEYLNLKETNEAYRNAYFGRDVGGPAYVNEVINRQGDALKRYNVEIK